MAEVEKVDPVMEKPWQRAKRFERYDFFRKSALPPMQIEPVPEERSRLAGEGMTPEQRALRKQWVKDQILHHEPREVPQLQPYNFFRRLYRWPADVLLYRPISKMFSKQAAEVVRYSVPKLVMTLGASYILWYHLKYNQNIQTSDEALLMNLVCSFMAADWTRQGGVVIYEAKPQILGSGTPMPEKEPSDYFDRGFKSRKALLYQPKE